MPEAFTGREFEIFFMDMSDYDALTASTVWVDDADAFEATVYARSLEISGGNVGTEEEMYFGDATLTFQQPREAFEVSMEVRVPTSSALKNKWEQMNFGAALTSAGEPVLQIMGLRATDGTTSEVKTIEFKNASMTEFNPTFEADSYWQASVTFRIPATDSDGNANVDFNDPTFTA